MSHVTLAYASALARAIRQSRLKKISLRSNELGAACINALLSADDGLLHAGAADCDCPHRAYSESRRVVRR